MKVFITVFLALFLTGAMAQTNKEAEALLKQVRAKTEAYKSQSIEFNNEMDAPTGKDDRSRSVRKSNGKAHVKANKYRIEMDGIIILNDGIKTYMVYPDDEEISVLEADEDEEGLQLTPSKILAEYEKGYSYALAGKETIEGKTIQYIRLKPKANAEIKEIVIGVDMSTKQLYSFKQFGHNGITTTLTVTKYTVNQPLKDELFSIKAPEFSSFEVF